MHPLELFGEGWWTEYAGEADDSLRSGSSLRRTADGAALPGCTSPPLEVPVSIGEGASSRAGAPARVRADAAMELNERCRSR